MGFTRTTLLTHKIHRFRILKYFTVFFLGASSVLLMTQGFNINTSLNNAVQYIRQIVLTSDGSNTTTTGIILDGTTTGGITITNLINTPVLGTNGSGKIIASISGNIYNAISGYITTIDRYTTGLTFNSNNNLLTLNVSGYGPVTGYINLSGANNRNSVYSWMLNSGNTLRNRYLSTGSMINTLATSTLNCSTGELTKFDGTAWVCSGDLIGDADSLRVENSSGDIYNRNLTGKVAVGLTGPTVDFQVSGSVIFGDPIGNLIISTVTFSSIVGGIGNQINGTSRNSVIAGGSGNLIKDAANSFAGGENARATENNTFVRNDGPSPFSSSGPNTFIIHSLHGVGINTADIAFGEDIEINQVMKLKGQTLQPFECSGNHSEYEGSVFMYTQREPLKSYLCYCGYGGANPDFAQMLMWRAVSDDKATSSCGNK